MAALGGARNSDVDLCDRAEPDFMAAPASAHEGAAVRLQKFSQFAVKTLSHVFTQKGMSSSLGDALRGHIGAEKFALFKSLAIFFPAAQ